jgi:hypothetical protein
MFTTGALSLLLGAYGPFSRPGDPAWSPLKQPINSNVRHDDGIRVVAKLSISKLFAGDLRRCPCQNLGDALLLLDRAIPFVGKRQLEIAPSTQELF